MYKNSISALGMVGLLAVASTAWCQSVQTPRFFATESRLELSCVRIVDAAGKTTSAWAVNLRLQTDAKGQLQLRLISPNSQFATVPSTCADRFQVSADGRSGDLSVTGINVDSVPGVTYDLVARATLPPSPNYDFSIVSLVQQPGTPTAESFSLVFSASRDGNSDCSFGNVENCRLFRVNANLQRNASGNATSLALDSASLKELLPNVGAVMADVSPDGTHVAFLHTGPTGTLNFRNSYVLNLATGSLLDLTSGQSHNGDGDWPHWLSNSELMYSNLNYCPEGSSSPGCSIDSRFSDLMKVTLSADRSRVQSTSFLFGDIDTAGLNSRACDASDSVRASGNSNLIAFHSTTIDGKSTVRDASCPWVAGLPGFNGQNYAGPKPVVLKLDTLAGKLEARDLKEGTHYFVMDMAAAGINSLAHLHFAANDTVLGTEQNTVVAPLRECSVASVALSKGLQACVDAGGKVILYNRIFGFENTGTRYENVRRAANPKLPLFTHRHPSALPGAERYFNPAGIGDNFQYKYAEFVNGSKTLMATVMSHDTNSTAMAFSRLMLIDVANPDQPFYFDLTGWLEDNFPSRWAAGKARGFTGTAGPKP